MYVPLLVDDFLHRPAKLFPNKLAIVDEDRRFSYAEYQGRVNQLSHALRRLGVEKGDRVCILSPNSHFFLESFYATSRIGAVLVPLNYRLVPEDHQYIIDHAGVSVMLVDYEYTDMIDAIRDQLPTVNRWIVAARDDREPEGWLNWDTLIAAEPSTLPEAAERDENDMVSINYTSGTTARPKGVMLTHRNCYINAYSFIAHLHLAHEDVELWTLPMFHCNGWGGVYAMTGVGGTHVVLRAVEGEKIFSLIQDEQVTFACMAPTVLRVVLDVENPERFDIKTKPRFVVAGAPPPAAFIERLEVELGWTFRQIYGLTETAPFLTSSQPDFATEEGDYVRRSRAGISGIGVDIKLLDDDDNEVPRDGLTVGEICARSNVVFSGYWRQPEETDKAIRDGYFHTGDLAVWDEHYNVHIVDRKKDVIISGGENISSPDIEATLYKHPAVMECAVIGVPSEKWGETPKALIVLRDGANVGEKQIIEFCRDNMAHFKCPTSVEFIEELPRTATGKLQKFRLREQFWGEGARKVAG
jgi:fatty-acyl-CoA synthase